MDKNRPEKRKKPKSLYYGLVMCALFFGIYYILTRERVIVSDVIWVCGRAECKVDYVIENQTSDTIDHAVMIRAFNNRSVGNGARVSDIVGELKHDIHLLPNEPRSFSKRVPLVKSIRVDIVSVSQYKPKK